MNRNYRFFERWVRGLRMKPICKVVEPDCDVLIADSGDRIADFDENGLMHWFYRTAFAVSRDQCWFASVNETSVYDAQMMCRTPGTAQQFRVDEALAYARKYMRQTKRSGLYDPDAKGRFSSQPDFSI
jgi:hypothetical protein